MRGSRNFRQGGSRSVCQKKLWQLFFFFSPQLILQKSNGQFQRNLSFVTVSEGVQLFPGGGVQLLMDYRNPYNLWFFRGVRRTPCPPSGSALGLRSACANAWIFYECWATDWTSFRVSKLTRRLHRLVWVYTCLNATMLEITCHGLILKLYICFFTKVKKHRVEEELFVVNPLYSDGFPYPIKATRMGLSIIYFKGSQVWIPELWCIPVSEYWFYLKKQFRPWWNATLYCISSEYSLFAKVHD